MSFSPLGTVESAAAALRAGTTTASELVEASLAAVDEWNPRTNAFVTVDADGARAAARDVDRARARGVALGPLHGVPISLKDLIDVAGVVTTAGSRVLRDRTAPTDATVVERLRRAGAIVIGRTNLHEFAMGTTSEDSAFGPVRHPFDQSRSPGGSSGGSAAAVLTGMGLASIGTDTGGSVRMPAAACGVVGLKPTLGEVPTDGVIPLSQSLDHVGPLTRTVQDAAWVWAVLAGRPPTDLVQPPMSQIRIVRLDGYFANPVDPEVDEAFETALRRLRQAGASIGITTLADTDQIQETYLNIVLAEAATWHARYLEDQPDDYTPPVRTRIASGLTIPAVDYLRARDMRARLHSHVSAALEHCDVLALPTLPIFAPPIGVHEIVIDRRTAEAMSVRAAMLKHTQLFNLTGHPAVSLPISGGSLPAALQLVGRFGKTERLMTVAASCEAVLRT